MKYKVNELEKIIIGFQRKDPEVFNNSVITMVRSDDVDTIIYNFTKIIPYMINEKLPVENAVNKQLEYPVIPVDTINSFGGGNESPVTNGNCHVCGFDKK